jgi:putative heme degradation protein
MRYSLTPTSLLVLLLAPAVGWAQQQKAPADTSTQHLRLREVVVTATRTEKALTEVPIPVTVIGKQQIKAMGSLRLSDVLGEQTGLNLVADHGRGIQMQGLNPEYTLILVDGEPLIGRTAGTLELSRVAVGNIERVEVVKGPGSEALAGVVNIITQKPQPGTRGEVRLRYGTNRTTDAGGTFNYKQHRLGLTIFGNRYSSAGYTLQPASGQATVPPFASYTAQSRISYQLDDKTTLSLSGRYFIENQRGELPISSESGQTAQVQRQVRQQDFSLNPTLFLGHWEFGFAVDENGRRSLQFFAADGEAVHKIYLLEESNHLAYDALVTQFRATGQPASLTTQPSPTPTPEADDATIDVEGFRAAWRGMTDTHEFFGLLRQFNVSRTQALRLGPPELLRQLAPAAIDQALRLASEQQLAVMIFVASRGCIQIHTGLTERIVPTGPWLNVLDPDFNLHLKVGDIAQAWAVQKPTADGIVTSVELYDAAGNNLLLLFGKRKPGMPELTAWRELVAAL